MSKSELIVHLYDEINRQNTWYMWTVGIFLVLITIILGFFSVLQWRLSENQIRKMKSEIENEVAEKFELNSIEKIRNSLDFERKASISALALHMLSVEGAGNNLSDAEQYSISTEVQKIASTIDGLTLEKDKLDTIQVLRQLITQLNESFELNKETKGRLETAVNFIDKLQTSD